MGGMSGQTWNWISGEWVEGNPPLVGPNAHALWMSSVVFDGARSFDGVAPDLDLHCARVVRSAQALGLAPMLTAGEIEELCWDGIRRFPTSTALYIRPMFYAESGFINPDPESTRFVLSLIEAPMPEPIGFTACISSFRRPAPSMAPTDAKAACLYPNAGRALAEATRRGFDNAILLDAIGNVAEYATANLFIARDGVVRTPVPNGTFLNGITRQRVIALLRADGIPVEECTLTPEDVLAADEVFSTGNYSKVVPVTRVEDRSFAAGPMMKRARGLYWEYAFR
ncbi:branched-chain amino acid aminotransferase [Azospirillum thermophilum]|uniref:Probable branched-chain-amino-acid aminotransferase n=1 Tax=Azospirillum thermophilum TaxID=2202148 RepID=A0A2S2CSZ9_9PROT|nr:branched-chain amino acid aminotransferase [Azospirillum thermophilum]AWK87589.1 branched-chain amino acid aminotransferase [Azospirillum thermophilum]